MRIIHAFFLFTLIMGGIGCSNSSAQQLYVSPTNGNDSWSGTSAQPNNGKTDGPVASVAKALALASAARSKSSKDTIYVNLAPGIHTLQNTLVFDANAGTSDNKFIVFQSSGTTNAVISGAARIQAQLDPTVKINKIPLNNVQGGKVFFEQLYQNGRALQRAREPDQGFLYMNDVKEDTLQKAQQSRAPASLSTYAIGNDKVRSDEFSKLKKLPPQSLQEVLVTIPYKWNVVKRYVGNLDDKGKRIVTQKGHGMGDFVQWGKGMQFYMENSLAFLDSPGEWYLDKDAGILYYYPDKSSQRSGTVTLDAPTLETLISFKGSNANQRVKNIIFRNLTFESAALFTPKDGFVAQQTSPFINAAIMADNAENITFDNCEFRNIGNNAIWFRASCANSKFTNNYFHDIGVSAIKIGEYKKPLTGAVTEKMLIDNNIIKSGGQLMYSAPGVVIYLAANNKVTHNEISDFKYSGISNGYTWQDTETPNQNNYFAYNYIHHLGWGVMDDLGGIYTVGHSENSVIENNVIHDVYCYRYSGFGIYLDEGSTGITVRNNLVYNCQSGTFICSFAKRDVITNNIFAFGKDAQLNFNYPSKGDASGFKFTNNIIVGEKGKLYGGKMDSTQLESDYNCYWYTGGSANSIFNGLSLDAWRDKTGKDQHSIVSNPYFVDPQQNNFMLKSTDIAKKINFAPFDVSKAGVYGSQTWKQKAVLPNAIINSFRQSAMNRRAN